MSAPLAIVAGVAGIIGGNKVFFFARRAGSMLVAGTARALLVVASPIWSP